MNFREISCLEFKKFGQDSAQKNFFQTPMMYQRMKDSAVEVYLLGVEENNKLVAASLVACSGTFLGKKAFEAYKGFLIDYENDELLTYFTQQIILFLKAKGGYKLIIDPYLPSISRDTEANIIDGINNHHLYAKLAKLGYNYIGETSQVKWVYCLDLAGKTKEQLLNEMRPSTRNYINRTMTKYQLKIRTLKYEELDQFKKITTETCERRSFGDKSLKYYQLMYRAFKDDVVYKVCELDCDQYLEVLINENNNFKQKIEELSDSVSNQHKKENMRQEIINNQQKISQIEQLKKAQGPIIVLAGAMFMLYGDEIVYLFSGSYEAYMNFCGQYALQWDIIQYALAHNYRRYNFYGIKDVFDKKGKDYGVYDFKKGFGGYVEELLGSFEIGFHPLYKIYNLLKKIKSLIK